MKQGSISQESIDKAFAILGIANSGISKAEETSLDEGTEDVTSENEETAEVDEPAENSEVDETTTDEVAGEVIETASNPEAPVVEKGEVSKDDDEDEDEDEDEDGDEEYSKLEKTYSKLKKDMSSLEDKMKGYKKGYMGKNEVVSKGVSDESDPITELIKAQEARFEDQVQALGTIQKSQEAEIGELRSQVENLENTTPGSRSVRSGYVEKSFGSGAEQLRDENVLSVSGDKRKILDLLEAKAGFDTEKGDIAQPAFAKAMGYFESTGILETGIAERLKVEDKISFVA